MEVGRSRNAAHSLDLRLSVLSHISKRPSSNFRGKLCSYWLAGRCNRNPCRFIHGGVSYATPITCKNSLANDEERPKKRQHSAQDHEDEKAEDKSRVCRYWISGKCVYSDQCGNLHSWYVGDYFSLFKKLSGHSKEITGITLPSGSSSLFSSSKDGIIRVWDYQSGRCEKSMNVGGEIGSLGNHGSWLFIGMKNVVTAMKIESPNIQIRLTGPIGIVYAIEDSEGSLFAGSDNGDISAWRFSSSETQPFEPVTAMKGHRSAVVSLSVGGSFLYSGSTDNTIRMWKMETRECVQILNQHSGPVTSLICWDLFLISGSLDKSMKVWAGTASGDLEAIYTRSEERGILKFHGMTNKKKRPILFASINEDSVVMYELPSFVERGRLFGKREVRAIEICSEEMFFTGDGAGEITVWKWNEEDGDAMLRQDG